MLSRVAQNLYWFGRTLERAENGARAADVEHQTALEGGMASNALASAWTAMIHASGAQAAFEEAAQRSPGLTAADFLVLSEENPNSIRATVVQARSLARALREHVSREVWEEVNALHLDLQGVSSIVDAELYDVCGRIRRRIQAVFGLFDNTVLFDEGREWFRSGLYLERADMTSRLLDAKYHIVLPSLDDVGGPIDRHQWMAILRSVSAWEAYRKLGHVGVTPTSVVETLMLSASFPRSVRFCVMALHRHLRNAMSETPPAKRVAVERPLIELGLEIEAADANTVIERGVHEFSQDVQRRLREIDQALSDHIFRALPERVA